MTTHSKHLRSTSRAFPGGLHFHFTKLPAYLLFSDGRLGTVHFLKPPAFGQGTHALPGALPARPRRRGGSRDPRSNLSCPKASPGAGHWPLPGAPHGASTLGPGRRQCTSKEENLAEEPDPSEPGPGFSLPHFIKSLYNNFATVKSANLKAQRNKPVFHLMCLAVRGTFF